MSAISNFINTIRTAVYGEQVRGAIADAITQCYDDVSNPSLNTAAFATAIAAAYADGFLDIQEKSTIAGMTNQKIIYRYTGTQSGYITNALYYYNGTEWVPIGSGLQSVNNTSLMTNTNVLYIYTGTQTGMVTNGIYYYNGTAWELVVNMSSLESTIEDVQNDLDAVADDVNELKKITAGDGIVDFDDYTPMNRVLLATDKWSEESENYQSIIIPVSADEYPVVAVEQGYTAYRIAFLTSDDVVEGETADLSAYYNTRINGGTAYAVTKYCVFPDVQFLYVELKQGATQSKPVSIKLLSNSVEEKADSALDAVADYKQVLLSDYSLNPSLAIEDAGNVKISGSGITSFLVPINVASEYVTVTANSEHEAYITFLKTETLAVANRAPFSNGFKSRIVQPAGTTVKYYIKMGDVKSLYVYGVGASSVDYTPSSIIAFTAGGGGEVGGLVKPKDRATYLARKRWQQFAKLPWTPKAAIPSTSSQTGISATSKVGVPYSSVKECDKYIGQNVSIKTFMTAVNNPYSLLYTEDVLGTRSRSAYGFTYHGVNCGAYFGAVCNSFVEYIAGMAIPYNTAEWDWCSKNGIFEKVYDQSIFGVEPYDFIWMSGHGHIAAQVWKDSNNQQTQVGIAEQVHDFPAYSTKSEASFKTFMSNKINYRWKELYKGIDYVPATEFVAADGETLEGYTYNDDICTYAGDYACFFDGEPVHINYAKGSYTSMQLYKGDSLIQTITLPSSYNTTHSVEVTNYLTGYGKYKARLTDGTNYSDYTYFEVVDCNVAATVENGILTVTFSSHNGTPLYVQVTDRAGNSKGIRALTDEEIQAGTVTYNAVALATAQSYTLSGTAYVKVFFVADYGTVRNDWLEVSF